MYQTEYAECRQLKLKSVAAHVGSMLWRDHFKTLRQVLLAVLIEEPVMNRREENFKLCQKTVGKFQYMPDKNFI